MLTRDELPMSINQQPQMLISYFSTLLMPSKKLIHIGLIKIPSGTSIVVSLLDTVQLIEQQVAQSHVNGGDVGDFWLAHTASPSR